MSKKKEHRNILKERLTLLLVFFFCILISGSEYIVEDKALTVETEQQETQDEGSEEEQNFYSAAVDAVVPFVFASVDHAIHLIYEIERHELNRFANYIPSLQYPNHYSEILLERIISTNAP